MHATMQCFPALDVLGNPRGSSWGKVGPDSASQRQGPRCCLATQPPDCPESTGTGRSTRAHQSASLKPFCASAPLGHCKSTRPTPAPSGPSARVQAPVVLPQPSRPALAFGGSQRVAVLAANPPLLFTPFTPPDHFARPTSTGSPLASKATKHRVLKGMHFSLFIEQNPL